MPTIPLENTAPISVGPSARTGAAQGLNAIATLIGQSNQQSFQNISSAVAARARLVDAERRQAAELRVAELQNRLSEAELETSMSTGNADEYVDQMEERTNEIFAEAGEGIYPDQLQQMAPKLAVLRSVHSLNVTQREFAKRADSARASLMQTERNALAIFGDGTRTQQEREFARSSYFAAVDQSVATGLVPAVDGEKIKNGFLTTGSKSASETRAAADIAFYSDVLFNRGGSARSRLDAVNDLPVDDATKQEIRDELEDRIAKDNQFTRVEMIDARGRLHADIITNPGKYSLAEIKSMPGIDDQDRPGLMKAYKQVRDGTAETKDDPKVLNELLNLAYSDPIAFSKQRVLGRPGLTLETQGRLDAWIGRIITRNDLPDDAKLTIEGIGIAKAYAKDQGVTGGMLVNFETAFAQAYTALDEKARPKTKREQVDLADQVLAEVNVKETFIGVDWLNPDSDVPFFRMNQEQLNTTIEEAPIEEWPQFLGDIAYGQLVKSFRAQGMSEAQARESADKAISNPAAVRAAARAASFPAPLIDTIEED